MLFCAKDLQLSLQFMRRHVAILERVFIVRWKRRGMVPVGFGGRRSGSDMNMRKSDKPIRDQ